MEGEIEPFHLRLEKAETGRSDRKNYIRSIRPLLDPSAGDAGNDGQLALGATTGPIAASSGKLKAVTFSIQ
jgi:hypothetical protein